MSVTAVLGAQWGDEGKGKLVDILSANTDICARFAGGNNAGHTIIAPIGPERLQTTFAFHLLPSGLINPAVTGIIGPGVVVHLPSFFDEFDTLRGKGLDCTGRLFISDRSHLVFDFHQIVDGLKEVELGLSSIGTTKKGIGPAYSAKASRSGLRVHHLFDTAFADKFRKIVEGRYKRYGHFEYDTEGEIKRYQVLAERLRPFVIDSVVYIHQALATGKRILVEGANALMLDIDYGTYPYVTSSSTTVGGICTGLGIPPRRIGKVIGVMKAYTTRVGGGPFPTEQLNDIGVHFQEIGREFGTTTGRRRRCGWLDLVVMKHSCQINGYDVLNLTKLDILDDLEEIKVAVKYLVDGKELLGFPANLETLKTTEVTYVTLPGWKTSIGAVSSYGELPENCKEYITFIEEYLKIPIEWIGVGPGRESMIRKEGKGDS
ncbi:Adenylosuccinate synthetase [Russula ochroleuca]|jgi:adenylosuccinate synthase|uniref:Adenylosuccinate synthetase n=1 Tax=Russula ochroleuca TaxID=152965 RepID=A0A9P5JYH2_9AGAM|nr:Adenylosuccinate synthetase [Russula ochroleuca]